MPAHIFLQLGMWPEAAASNQSAWEASDTWMRRKKLSPSVRDYHSLHWLLYAYLQQGDIAKARALFDVASERFGKWLAIGAAAGVSPAILASPRTWLNVVTADGLHPRGEVPAALVALAVLGEPGDAGVLELLGRAAHLVPGLRAARHPDLFSSTFSYSGAPDIASRPETIAGSTLIINATEVGLNGDPPNTMFGSRATNEVNWKAHDPATLAETGTAVAIPPRTTQGFEPLLDGWLQGEQWLYARRAPGNTCLGALTEARKGNAKMDQFGAQAVSARVVLMK